MAAPLLRLTAGPVIEALGSPVGAIVALSALAFFAPSFLAGVPAPVLAHVAIASEPARAGRSLGLMFAAGALGAICGTLLAGFLFISWLGTILTMAVVAVTYATLALVLVFAAQPRHIARQPAMIVAILGVAIAALTPLLPNPCTRESDYFCIRAIDVSAEAGAPARLMVIDHLGHGISAGDDPLRMLTPQTAMLDELGRRRMEGQSPFRAYFIGGGSYSVPRAWTEPPAAARVTVAEIDPAVTAVAVADFWLDTTRMDIVHRDARLALVRSNETYDVIVGDAFTDIAAPAHLVTDEFFGLVASRLNPGGVYLMNVVDRIGTLDALASVVATLRRSFPVVEVWAEETTPVPGERAVFILLAASTQTPFSRLDGRTPDWIRSGRLTPKAVDALVARRKPVILTDDFAPIDRLIGRFD